MLRHIAHYFPNNKTNVVLFVNIPSVLILSDLAHDLKVNVKETEEGCFIAELNYEGGKIILKTK